MPQRFSKGTMEHFGCTVQCNMRCAHITSLIWVSKSGRAKPAQCAAVSSLGRCNSVLEKISAVIPLGLFAKTAPTIATLPRDQPSPHGLIPLVVFVSGAIVGLESLDAARRLAADL